MQIYLYTHSQLEARNANAVRAEKAVRRWSESQAENGFIPVKCSLVGYIALAKMLGISKSLKNKSFRKIRANCIYFLQEKWKCYITTFRI